MNEIMYDMEDLIDRRALLEALAARLQMWKGLSGKGGSSLSDIAGRELEDVIEIVKSAASL